MKYIMNDTKEERRDRARRINVIDILFILLAVALVLVSVSYFTDFSFFGIGGEIRTLEYVVEFEGVDANMADRISSGDSAVSGSERFSMGKVINVEKAQDVRFLYNSENSIIERVAIPADENGNTTVTLKVTLVVDAEFNAGKGYSVNGNRIAVGQTTELVFTGYSGTGKCVSIKYQPTKN